MSKTIHREEYKRIAQGLKNARQEVGLTQAGVARRLKESQSYISKIEAGEQRIDIIELKRFALLYKKPVSYFID